MDYEICAEVGVRETDQFFEESREIFLKLRCSTKPTKSSVAFEALVCGYNSLLPITQHMERTPLHEQPQKNS